MQVHFLPETINLSPIKTANGPCDQGRTVPVALKIGGTGNGNNPGPV